MSSDTDPAEDCQWFKAEYERRKPLAWAAARRILATPTAPQAVGEPVANSDAAWDAYEGYRAEHKRRHQRGVYEGNRDWEMFHAGWLAAPVAPRAGEEVAWRDHIEQRLRAWRQRFVNKSGDQLALDDFMDAESLEDLLDYVLDEWATPPAPAKGEPQ